MAKKMKSLEYVPREKSLGDSPIDVPSSPMYPCFYLDSKQMPEIEDWKVGEEYEMTIKVHMKSLSKREDDDRYNAEFSVESYAREDQKSLN